jgi:hypothetical protein
MELLSSSLSARTTSGITAEVRLRDLLFLQQWGIWMGVRKATKKIGEVGIRPVESKGMELHLVLDPMLPPLPTEVGTHGRETLVAVRVGMDRD